MTNAQKLLIIGGLSLSIIGMFYGLYYALFDEHQTLTGMGMSLSEGFSHAADRDLLAAQQSINSYGKVRAEYVREVHAHSHLISLGMLLIVLGMAFNLIALNQRYSFVLASTLLAGAIAFPLGAILQIFHLGFIVKLLSIVGVLLLIISMSIVVWGFFTPISTTPDPDTKI